MEGSTHGYPDVTPAFSRAADGQDCDVCGAPDDVCQIVGTLLVNRGSGEGYPCVSYLCSRCMAGAIEVVTGFKARKVVESWYTARDNARAWKLTAKAEAALGDKG